MKSKLLTYLATPAFLAIATSAFALDHHAADEPMAANEASAIELILEAQPDVAKARYQYRNPKETIEFFGITPGMKIAEALPGGGWYTKILLPYLGADGALVGVDYTADMWPNFSFVDEAFIERKKTWVETWTNDAQPWRGETGATVSAATFGAIPEDINGSLDAVLFIRALHNLARFEDTGEYLSKALAETFIALKPGGMVGIVQHQAREDRDDEWANGNNGYLKKSFVLAQMAAAGFEYVGESDINANEKDQANVGDIVWRLPPSLNGAKDDEELKQKMLAIGESNRMTLLFRKPAA